jgi:hypothetical protein
MGQFLAAFDERLEVWEDETNASQAGLFPGTAVPDRTTRLVPIPTGEGSADTVYLQEMTGGFPGAGSSWAYRTVPGDPWIGFDPPTAVTYTEQVEWDAALGAQDHFAPSLCVDDNDVVILCSEYRSAGAGTRAIYVGSRATDGTWVISASSMWSETVSASERKLWPVVARMPDGRIRLYHFHHDDQRDIAQVWAWELEDGGTPSDAADWTLISRACLSSPIDTSGGDYPSGLRVAVGRGQVLLVWTSVIGAVATLQQWYSRNNGISFDFVSSLSTEGDHRFDVAFAHGSFVLAHAANDPDTVDELLVVRRVANAATALSGATSVTVRSTLTAADDEQLVHGVRIVCGMSENEGAMRERDVEPVVSFGGQAGDEIKADPVVPAVPLLERRDGADHRRPDEQDLAAADRDAEPRRVVPARGVDRRAQARPRDQRPVGGVGRRATVLELPGPHLSDVALVVMVEVVEPDATVRHPCDHRPKLPLRCRHRLGPHRRCRDHPRPIRRARPDVDRPGASAGAPVLAAQDHDVVVVDAQGRGEMVLGAESGVPLHLLGVGDGGRRIEADPRIAWNRPVRPGRAGAGETPGHLLQVDGVRGPLAGRDRHKPCRPIRHGSAREETRLRRVGLVLPDLETLVKRREELPHAPGRAVRATHLATPSADPAARATPSPARAGPSPRDR